MHGGPRLRGRVQLVEGYALLLWTPDDTGNEFILGCPKGEQGGPGPFMPITEAQAEGLIHDEIHPRQLDQRYDGRPQPREIYD